jgi:hypothetical protein
MHADFALDSRDRIHQVRAHPRSQEAWLLERVDALVEELEIHRASLVHLPEGILHERMPNLKTFLERIRGIEQDLVAASGRDPETQELHEIQELFGLQGEHFSPFTWVIMHPYDLRLFRVHGKEHSSVMIWRWSRGSSRGLFGRGCGLAKRGTEPLVVGVTAQWRRGFGQHSRLLSNHHEGGQVQHLCS